MATYLSLAKKIPAVVGYNRPVASEHAEILGGKFFAQIVSPSPKSVEEVVARIQRGLPNRRGAHLWCFGNPSAGMDALPIPPLISTLGMLGRARGARIRGTRNRGLFRSSDDKAQPNAQWSPPPSAAPTQKVKTPPGMTFVPTGTFRKGLTDRQLEALLARFKGMGLDVAQSREVLSMETDREGETKAFFIDRTPVTNSDFARFIEAKKYVTFAERNSSPAKLAYFSRQSKSPRRLRDNSGCACLLRICRKATPYRRRMEESCARRKRSSLSLG